MKTTIDQQQAGALAGRAVSGLRMTKLVLAAVGLAVLLALPATGSLALVSLLNQIGIAIIFALAYNMLLGQSGLLSFGHAVYYGVGAFWAIQLMYWIGQNYFYVPTPLVPIAGGLGGLVFGFVLGSFCVRSRGTIFALITLAVGELMTALTIMLNNLSGGEEGISAWRQGWLWFSFSSAFQVYYVVLFWVILCAALMYGITRTPFGRLMLAVRDNEERARFMGFNTYRVRLTVFCLSGLFAGVSGGLLAVSNELINYEVMSIVESGNVLFNAFIGGMTYFSGPIIGATLLTALQLNLSNYTDAWLVYEGILFVLVVMFAPGGIAGIIYVHGPVLRARLWRGLVRPYAIAAVPGVLLLGAGIFLIEFIYHWSSASYAAGAAIHLFGVTWNPSSVWPWLLVVVGDALGLFLLLRYAIPAVTAAWGAINERLAASEEG